MATNFPSSIDTEPNPGVGTYRDDAGFELDILVSNMGDAIEAIETKVGVDGSAVTTSVDWLLNHLKPSASVSLPSDISPAQITADQNNYNPAGLDTATILRLNCDGTLRNITGLTAPTTNADGRIIAVCNISSAGINPFVLKSESGSSTAANRFSFQADLQLSGGTCVVLYYDVTSSRWRGLSMDGLSGAPSGTAGGDLAGTFPNPNVNTVMGGLKPAVVAGTVRSITALTTIVSTDETILAGGSTNYNVTFPDPLTTDTYTNNANWFGRRFTVKRTGTGTITLVASGTGPPVFDSATVLTGTGQTITYECMDGTNWRAISQVGAVDLQVFTATGAGTWTKPGGAFQIAQIVCIGGGGGGASGRRGAAGSARGGGGGGTGGAYSLTRIPLSILGATETVSVGVGGAAGGVQTTNDTDGIGGGNGGNTTFGTTVKCFASGGGGGGGGTTVGGLAGSTAPNGSFTGGASGAGGLGAGTSVAGSAVNQGAGGGGGAGGITTGNVASDGASGSLQRETNRTGGGGGTGGAAGGAGTSSAAGEPQSGSGGGGAGAAAAGAGTAGGAGGLYGGGGGGGAASVNGSNSGAGGAGQQGIILVVCD